MARKKSTKKTTAQKAASRKKSTKYLTIDGKKHVWRKGYTTSTGKRVKGRYVPLTGAAKKAHKTSKPKKRRNPPRRGIKRTSGKKTTAQKAASRKKSTKHLTIDGKKHVWRKGYTTQSGKRVKGRYVPVASGTKRRSTKRRRNSYRKLARRLRK